MTIITQTPLPSIEVGHRLRIRREQLGLEQREVADTSGLSRNTIWNYERGNTRPSRAALKLLAMALDAPEEWLLNGTVPRNDEGPASEETGPTGDVCARRDLNPRPIDLESWGLAA